MLRKLALVTFALLTIPAWAQPARGPQGEDKLRWVTERLQLDDKQQQQAKALLDVYRAELDEADENKIEILRKIQTAYAELDEARAAGDDARVKQLSEQIQKMGPLARAENNYFTSLEQVLNPEQKQLLAKLQKDVTTAPPPAAATPPNATPAQPPAHTMQPPMPGMPPQAPAEPPASTLRPVHVLKAVHGLSLSKEQNERVEAALQDFRDAMRTDPPRDVEQYGEKTERLVRTVRPLLTSEQAEKFDRQLEDLRANPPAAEPLPGRTQPTGPTLPVTTGPSGGPYQITPVTPGAVVGPTPATPPSTQPAGPQKP